MSEDFTQLDELIESDVREALGEPASVSEIGDEVLNIPEELMDEVVEPAKTDSVDDVDTSDESEGEVLEDIGDIDILPMAEIESALDEDEPVDTNIASVNTSDLASLLSQLLNNKTIEITIKIKD